MINVIGFIEYSSVLCPRYSADMDQRKSFSGSAFGNLSIMCGEWGMMCSVCVCDVLAYMCVCLFVFHLCVYVCTYVCLFICVCL